MVACFCSWSGGKDSCLALYKAINMGYCPKFLLTTCTESGDRSYSHGLLLEILQAQAKSLGLPLVLCNTSWENYRVNFINKITEAKKQIFNTTAGIFGDIDLAEHREWVQKVCLELDCEPILPLWERDRKTIFMEFLNAGFKAKIVAVDSKKLPPTYLDRLLDIEILQEFIDKNIDPCGENGEYHTVVIDGPIFSLPLNIKKCNNPKLHSGYWVQDFIRNFT